MDAANGCSSTAPYFLFPVANQDLADVDRLFGLSNFMRICNSVPEPQRHTAMQTMILEARMRRLDPVRGACGVVDALIAQVMASELELAAVRRRLALYQAVGQSEAPPQRQQMQQNEGSLRGDAQMGETQTSSSGSYA